MSSESKVKQGGVARMAKEWYGVRLRPKQQLETRSRLEIKVRKRRRVRDQ